MIRPGNDPTLGRGDPFEDHLAHHSPGAAYLPALAGSAGESPDKGMSLGNAGIRANATDLHTNRIGMMEPCSSSWLAMPGQTDRTPLEWSSFLRKASVVASEVKSDHDHTLGRTMAQPYVGLDPTGSPLVSLRNP